MRILQKVRKVDTLQVDLGRLAPLELPQRINPVIFQGTPGIAATACIRISPMAHVQDSKGLVHVPGIFRKLHAEIRTYREFPVVKSRAVALGITYIRLDKSLDKTVRLFCIGITLKPFAGNIHLALHMHEREIELATILRNLCHARFHARGIPAFIVSLTVAPREVAGPSWPQAQAHCELIMPKAAVCKQRAVQIPLVL